MDGGRMNAAAQNSINPELLGVADYRLFEFADEAYCVLHSLLRVSAERPVAESKSPAHEIDRRIKREQKLVSGIAKISEPFRVLDDGVEFMPVNHENAATISRDVNSVFLDRNVSVSAPKCADEFVVILRPVASASQLPDIDQIADDIELLAIVIAQEL